METEEVQEIYDKLKNYNESTTAKEKQTTDVQMTSSTVSMTSSLASPVDSGVQLLDSESEITSMMSTSGFGCDIDAIPNLDSYVESKNTKNVTGNDLNDEKVIKGGCEDCQDDDSQVGLGEEEKQMSVIDVEKPIINELESGCKDDEFNKKDEEEEIKISGEMSGCGSSLENPESKMGKPVMKQDKLHVMTSSDIDNQNVMRDFSPFSMSVPNYFDKFDLSPTFEKFASLEDKRDAFNKSFSDEVFEMEHPIKRNIKNEAENIMNISLNSYELLDYTIQNTNPVHPENNDQMNVSMSEEVNENLKVALGNTENIAETVPNIEPVEVKPVDIKPPEDQIVFRRQRKKKSKSDTPKKRVSFHEDILNSTKIDDIHINHGFITHEPDVSLSFFQRGFIRKPDVVKGRYSWAAEGDAPYYEKNGPQREIKSDIYIHNPRYSSTSSSSTGSISSSIDEEDNSDENNVFKKEISLQKVPKSSCLKKSKSNKKYIDTNIVQEEIHSRKKKSETNLLDTSIFGSLKNILSFSTSVPLAERGVPEGQEDITIYSSSHDISNRRHSLVNLSLKNFETVEVKPTPPIVKNTESPKANLNFTRSEGFYPNYPNNQNLPANIILCDSNVYEHKGISYSYEYDKFQKTFEQENKPKSSTVYQMILKEFNFFRRKAKEEPETEAEEDFEIIPNASTPVKEEKIEQVEEPEINPKNNLPKNSLNKYASTTKLDWSDNETVVSDFSESLSSRHLNSPKRKIKRNNHYSVQSSFKLTAENLDAQEMGSSRSLQNLRPSSSKSSLINRFLRNVTLKKMLDAKAQNKQKNCRNYMGLYVKGIKVSGIGPDEVDEGLAREIINGRQKFVDFEDTFDKKMLAQFRRDIFRSRLEKLLKVLPVRSAYATSGDSKPLLVILTTTTIYIAGFKPNTSSYCNYFVLPYTELNTILVGPNAQTIHISNYDKDMQCLITTGCANITSSLVGQLEIAMRRDINKPKLPAVKQLTMRDMANLRRAVCKQTSVHKDEEYFFYSIVNIQDFNSDVPEHTPLGPNKEGPLMFKTNDFETRWETAYFILKAGVLYMLSSASQRVPMSVFPLINGSCQGARRVFNDRRPHTFQLIIEGKSLHLAAPDEYVASEWLQELVHAASGTYSNREKPATQSCSLLMTSDHILTVREAFPCTINSLLTSKSDHQPIKGPQALSCAAIVDLTSFRLPSAEQSWCILEFACREVHECSGDWILYFSSNSELENFISTLEMLWAYNNEQGDSFPLSTIPESDPLSRRCVDVYTSLIGTWPSNTVHLQFM